MDQLRVYGQLLIQSGDLYELLFRDYALRLPCMLTCLSRLLPVSCGCLRIHDRRSDFSVPAAGGGAICLRT